MKINLLKDEDTRLFDSMEQSEQYSAAVKYLRSRGWTILYISFDNLGYAKYTQPFHRVKQIKTKNIKSALQMELVSIHPSPQP